MPPGYALTELTARYARAVDRREPSALAELFTADAVFWGQISGRPQTQTTAEVVDHPHDLRHSCRRCLLVDIDRIVEFGAVEGVDEQGYRLRVRSLQQIS